MCIRDRAWRGALSTVTCRKACATSALCPVSYTHLDVYKRQSLPVLVSLLVCLIPTTIGGLLSAIGISGIDRLVRRNEMCIRDRPCCGTCCSFPR